MWRILQQEEPEDFVLATGEMHSVREFVEKAFTHVNVKVRYVYIYVSNERSLTSPFKLGRPG